ncbi:MAG: hypothetical protein AB1473_23695 [Thermodesulfobacteriota bacterium]
MFRIEGGFWFGVMVVCTLFLMAVGSPSGAEGPVSCSTALQKWDTIMDGVEKKLQEYQILQQTPLEQIIRKPLVDRNENKTIARQISEAIQAKEELLAERRKECLTLLNQEKDLFDQVERCSKGDSARDREFRRLEKKRQRLVGRAVMLVAEVREVQGREDYAQYADYSRQQNYYENQWRNQQQMYMRSWGR